MHIYWVKSKTLYIKYIFETEPLLWTNLKVFSAWVPICPIMSNSSQPEARTVEKRDPHSWWMLGNLAYGVQCDFGLSLADIFGFSILSLLQGLSNLQILLPFLLSTFHLLCFWNKNRLCILYLVNSINSFKSQALSGCNLTWYFQMTYLYLQCGKH